MNKTLSDVEIRCHLNSATWLSDWIKPRFRETVDSFPMESYREKPSSCLESNTY